MTDPQKHTILTRFWIGDTVFSAVDNAKGLVVAVSIHSTYEAIRYFVVFDDRKGEWCEDMELSGEKVFNDAPDADAARS